MRSRFRDLWLGCSLNVEKTLIFTVDIAYNECNDEDEVNVSISCCSEREMLFRCCVRSSEVHDGARDACSYDIS